MMLYVYVGSWNYTYEFQQNCTKVTGLLRLHKKGKNEIKKMKTQPCTNVIVIWTLRVWKPRRYACLQILYYKVSESLRWWRWWQRQRWQERTLLCSTLLHVNMKRGEKKLVFCRKNEQHIPPFFVQKRRYHFRRLFVLVILNLLKNMSKTFYNMQTNFRQGNVKRK